MANYRGWVWANWDKEAPSLEDYLGDMKIYFDIMTDLPDGTSGGQRLWVGVQKWTIPANWKFAAENFAGDFYHNISHRSVDIVGISPSGRKGRHPFDNTIMKYKVGASSNLWLELKRMAPATQQLCDQYLTHEEPWLFLAE